MKKKVEIEEAEEAAEVAEASEEVVAATEAETEMGTDPKLKEAVEEENKEMSIKMTKMRDTTTPKPSTINKVEEPIKRRILIRMKTTTQL